MVDFRKYTKNKGPRLDLNPSSAERWTTCTASPHFILENWDKVPPDDTKFNQEGTTAHEVAAALLQDRKPRVKDSYHCPVAPTPEMHRHAWDYMEYVTGLKEPGDRGKLLVEQKLPLWYMPERNAIIDAAVINPSYPQSIHIIDFKYGEGVVVSPVENLQAVIYVQSVLRANWGLTNEFIPDIHIHIFQPRGRAAEDEPSHFWSIKEPAQFDTFDELTTRIEKAAQAILSKNTLIFAPSPKACQFCPAKGFCPARHEHFAKDVKTLEVIPSGDKHLPPVKAVSAAQLAAILKHKSAIEKWLKDAEQYALQFMCAGGELPGWKVVTSRAGNRYWRDPKKAAALLLEHTHLRKEEVIEEKTISPAGVDELLGKNKLPAALLELIDRPPGKPVIAPADDKRESALIDPRKEFAE